MRKVLLIFIILGVILSSRIVCYGETYNLTEKLKTLNESAQEYREFSPDNSIKYAKEALELARQVQNKSAEVDALRNLALGYRQLGQLDKDLDYLKRSLSLAQQINYLDGMGNAYNSLGNHYYDTGNYSLALQYHLQALEIREKTKDKGNIAKTYNNIGRVYAKLSNYKQSLIYYQKALTLKKGLEDKKGITNTLNNMSLVYLNMGEIDKSYQCSKQALEICQKINYQQGLAYSLDNIGNAYTHLNNQFKALDYYFQALKAYKKIDYQQGQGYCLYNIACSYYQLGDYQEAAKYYTQSLNLAKIIGDKSLIRDNYLNLSGTYGKIKEYARAYAYYKDYDLAKENILNQEVLNKIALLEVQDQIEKKKREIELLKKDIKIKELMVSRQSIVIMSTGFLLVLFCITMYNQKKQIILGQEREKRLLEIKSNLEECNNSLQILSNIDGLTGVANRRHFDKVFSLECQRSENEGIPLSLIMLDLDFYKLYNDTYGHPKGDECLRQIAQVLKNYFSYPDSFVARYGGEEFIVLLPGNKIKEAVDIAEELRTKIENLRVAHAKSKVSDWVTISLGVSSTEITDNYLSVDLLAAADKALYLAKNAGRNQVKYLRAICS